jgi:hypothetical protein
MFTAPTTCVCTNTGGCVVVAFYQVQYATHTRRDVLLCLDTSEGVCYVAWTHQKGCVALLGHIRRAALLCLDTSEGLCCFAWTSHCLTYAASNTSFAPAP